MRGWAAWLIIVAGLLAYANSFSGPFIFDDLPAIVDNTTIRSLWPLQQPLSPRAGTAAVEGRPILNLSLALNYAVHGLNVRGYHLTNLAIHLLAGLALYGFTRRTLRLPSVPESLRRSADGLALTIALIWTVHPLQTESVTYMVQRAESLGGLLYLFTLYAVARGAEKAVVGCPLSVVGEESEVGSPWSSPSRRWYAVAVVTCAIGMGAKEILLTAPLLLLAYDRIFLATSWRQVWAARAGLYLGMAATWALLVLLKITQHGAYVEGLAGTVPLAPSLDMITRPDLLLEFFRSRLWADVSVGPWTYLITQPGVLLHYLRLTFWPATLCLYYNWPFLTTMSSAWPGLAGLGAAIAVVGWALVRHPRLGFLGLWFFLILAPSSSILPTDDAAFEHRMYLSLAAVVAAAVLAVHGLAHGLAGESRRPGVVRACGILALLVVLALGLRTAARNRDYRSTLAIWEATLRVSPDNPMALHSRGVELAQRGRADEARADLLRLIALQPENAEGHASLADVYRQAGEMAAARQHFETAVGLRPGNVNARIGLANMLMLQGEVDAALVHLQAAVLLRPDKAEAQSNLGIALCSRGALTEGLPHLAEAVRLQPDNAASRNNLGRALLLLGRLPEAHAQLAEAVRLKPDYDEAQRNLEAVRRKMEEN